MRLLLIGLSFITLGSLSANQSTQALYPYPPVQNPGNPQAQTEGATPEEEIADRRSNSNEYNLYDRQQNRIEQNERQQQQQYYYQQSGGNSSDGGTQYNRSRSERTQYFNPRDE